MDRTRTLRVLIAGSQIVGVAVAWYATAKLGLMVVGPRAGVSPWWPPAGVAVVALLVFGPRVCPGIFLASFLNDMSIPGVPPASAPLTALGVTLAPLCGYVLLRRIGFRLELDRIRDAFALVVLAAFGAMTISATFGTVTRMIFGAIPLAHLLASWLTWWTGDAMGVIAVAPFLLSLRTLRWRDRPMVWSRWIEILALLIGSSVVVFVATKSIGALYVGFVFVGWAAWRYQLAGAAPCSLLVSIVAIAAATDGYGPFADQDLTARLIDLQLFNTTLVLGGLLLAAAVTERNGARGQIEQTVVKLSNVVNQLERKRIRTRDIDGHSTKGGTDPG